MDSPGPVAPDPAPPPTPDPAAVRAPGGALGRSRWASGVVARLRLGAGAVVVLLLLALAVAVLVSLLTPTGASATLERPAASPTDSTPAASASPSPSDPASASTGATPGPTERPVLVHVLGSVAEPGLFALPVGARVVDAVAAAGGLTSGADQARINLARTVADGEQLYVPAVGEVAPLAAPPAPSPSGPGASGATDATAVVNLNTATIDDLDTLPRIGPGLAQRIVDWRTANGRFTAPEDLLEVPGIGGRTFDGLRERVTV